MADTQRALRFSDRRALNTLDPAYRTSQRETGILVTEGAAVWTDPYFVAGYDEITFMVEFRAGNADGFRLAAQYAWRKEAPTAEWLDCYEDAGGGVLARKVWAYDGATVNLAFTERIAAPWVRFKLWGQGADLTGSDGVLYTMRHMLA